MLQVLPALQWRRSSPQHCRTLALCTSSAGEATAANFSSGFLHNSSSIHTSVNPWSLVAQGSKWSSSGALLKKTKNQRYKKHNWEIIEKDCKELLLVISWCSFITKLHHWGLHSVLGGIRLLITNQAGSQLLVKGACWTLAKISHS